MTTRVIHGSNQQIADAVARMPEKVLEAILLLEGPAGSIEKTAEPLTDAQFEQLLAEMDAHAVSIGGADYSRASIYSRQEGE